MRPRRGYQDIIGGPFRRHDKDQQTRRRSLIQVLRRDKLPVEHAFDTSQNAVQFGQRGTPSTELDHVGTPSEQAEVARIHHFDHVAEPCTAPLAGHWRPPRPVRHPASRG